MLRAYYAEVISLKSGLRIILGENLIPYGYIIYAVGRRVNRRAQIFKKISFKLAGMCRKYKKIGGQVKEIILCRLTLPYFMV